jgi:uncharacterized protein YegJ (DUF2314 family)
MMNIKFLLLSVFTISILFTSCEDEQKYSSVDDNETEQDIDPVFKDGYNDATFLAESDDARIARARDSAQAEINYFTEALAAHPNDSNYVFLVKSGYTQNDTVEHMWSEVQGFSEGNFLCILIDQPYWIRDLYPGERISIPLLEVGDWILYDYVADAQFGNFLSRQNKDAEVIR